MATQERQKRIEKVMSRRREDIVVILEDVSDPHNAGAVLRSCDAFGIGDVFYVFKSVEPYDPKTVGKLSSSSANKWVNTHVSTSIEDCISELKEDGFEIWCTAIDEHAEKLGEVDFGAKLRNGQKIAVLFGNEHAGASEKAKKLSDHILYIPMKGFVESLNISVAAAVVLWEVGRSS